MSGVLSEQSARNTETGSKQRKTPAGTGASQSVVPVTSVHRVEGGRRPDILPVSRRCGSASAPPAARVSNLIFHVP